MLSLEHFDQILYCWYPFGTQMGHSYNPILLGFRLAAPQYPLLLMDRYHPYNVYNYVVPLGHL